MAGLFLTCRYILASFESSNALNLATVWFSALSPQAESACDWTAAVVLRTRLLMLVWLTI